MATSVFDEIIAGGEQIIEEIRKLLKDSSVRKITIKNKDGKVLLETPLTFGAIGMGGMMLFHPILSAVAAFAMFANDVKIEVERTKEYETDKEVDADIIDIDDEETKE